MRCSVSQSFRDGDLCRGAPGAGLPCGTCRRRHIPMPPLGLTVLLQSPFFVHTWSPLLKLPRTRWLRAVSLEKRPFPGGNSWPSAPNPHSPPTYPMSQLDPSSGPTPAYCGLGGTSLQRELVSCQHSHKSRGRRHGDPWRAPPWPIKSALWVAGALGHLPQGLQFPELGMVGETGAQSYGGS